MMALTVPSGEEEIRLYDDVTMRVNPKRDGLWYHFANADVTWKSVRSDFQRVMEDQLSKGDTVIDIGAHLGYFSLMGRREVGPEGAIYAFEPHPESFELLSRNISDNKFSNITVENELLAESRNEILLDDSDKSIRATISQKDSGTGHKMMSLPFDEYAKKHKVKPDFVKMNAEGAELSIIKGMNKVLADTHPYLLMEVHPHLIENQGGDPEELVDILTDTGYNTFNLINVGEFTPNELKSECQKRMEPFRITAEAD